MEKKRTHKNEMYRAKTEDHKKHAATTTTRVTTQICDGYNEMK